MNYTESFEQFASKLGPTDIALYAGVGLVLWVLFKDRLSPVQSLVGGLIDQVKKLLNNNKSPSVVTSPVVSSSRKDVFFDLVVSWKQTRDLAVSSGCTEAVKIADQMFPHLSPDNCGKVENV